MVSEITDPESYRTELQKAGLMIIDFYSTQCPPCKVVGPLYERLPKKEGNQNFRFFKVNGLAEPGSCIQQAAEVTWWPTFVVYKDGKEIWRARVQNPPAREPVAELEQFLESQSPYV